MAEPRLGPDELDRLEDALEGLEWQDALDDPSAPVAERLADFKLILQASREALPLEEVRPGVLDGVLAEARMSAQDIRSPAAAKSTGESFWARLRKAWLVPGLAVAGSAALVLILLQPTLSDDGVADKAEAVAVNEAPASEDAPAAAAPAKADARRTQSPAGAARALPEVLEDEAAQEEAPAAAPPPPPADVVPQPAPTSTLEKAKDQAPAPEEADLKQDASTGQGWNAIEEGDAARKGGDCFSARNHYARALDDGNDSVRARAYVGMGLCKRAEGNNAAANEYFDQARELDEDALEFAGTQSKERKSKPVPRRPRKKSSGKRKKNSIGFDEANDPLSGL